MEPCEKSLFYCILDASGLYRFFNYGFVILFTRDEGCRNNEYQRIKEARSNHIYSMRIVERFTTRISQINPNEVGIFLN
jgi:hypothetical protein